MSDKPNVLLVEDAKPQAVLFQQYLKNEMINLTHVATGEDAKTIIAANPPDLILLDLKLPDMEGQEILRWIKQEKFLRKTGHCKQTANNGQKPAGTIPPATFN